MSRPMSVFALAVLATVTLPVVGRAVGPLQLYTVVPCRVADTRDPVTYKNGGPWLTHGVTRNFAVLGDNSRPCGLPIDGSVRAVVINATVVTPTAFGHLTIWPYGTATPGTANINFSTGETAIANGAIVPTSTSLSWQLSAYAALADAGHTDLVIDITGYFIR